MQQTAEISQYEQERRQKLQKLRELGVDPFGGRVEGVTPLAQIKSSYSSEMGHDGGPVVKGAGRVVLKRDMGKLSLPMSRLRTTRPAPFTTGPPSAPISGL